MKATSKNGTVYSRSGQPGAACVILVHGLGLTRATWDQHLAAFNAHFDVITYDLLGHGESPPPSGNINLRAFSDQIISLMDELSIETAAIVGFSLGGMINRRMAMDYSDRVSALVILNSPHERGEEAQKLVEERAAKTDTGGPGATIDETIKRWFTPLFIQSRPDIINNIKGWVLSNEPTAYTKCRYVLAAGVVELIRPVPPISHPTLVMTCEYDSGSTPAMSHTIASEITNAETIIVPDLQHMGLVERPGLFTAPVISFLRQII